MGSLLLAGGPLFLLGSEWVPKKFKKYRNLSFTLENDSNRISGNKTNTGGEKMAVREDKVIIRLTPELKAEFQELAESMGMTMSGLGAFVIGNFMKQEKTKSEMNQKLLEKIAPQFMESINKVDMDDPRIMKTMSETISMLMTQNQSKL